MIITDIEQIDHLAREISGTTMNIISVDMNDYECIKEQASSLKAIKLDIPEITEKNLSSLNEALKEVCNDKECNLLMHISGNGVTSGAKAITVEQMQLIHESIEKNVSRRVGMVWGVGECESVHDEITILIIAGFCK